MIGFIDDIIRIPKRDSKEIILDYKNQINYWKLYEQTYKQNKFYKIDHESISLNEISCFVDYIENIKYNFHFYCFEEFEKNVLFEFIIKLNEIEKENIYKINQEVFNFEKKNIHFLKIFFKCVDRAISISKKKNILINELDLIKHISHSLIEIINLVEISKIEVIIKINLQLDKYLEIVPDSVKNLICNKVFYLSLSNKLIDCFKIDFDKMINLVQHWKTISDKMILFNSSYT